MRWFDSGRGHLPPRYLLICGLAALGIALAISVGSIGPAAEHSIGVMQGSHGTVEIRYLLCDDEPSISCVCLITDPAMGAATSDP